MPLIPARLEFAADGTPWSDEFGDVYHSAAGGPAQARHVFLAGNRLPERWAGRERFVILETGFGFGLNFLATWQAWRRDPARCGGRSRASLVQAPRRPRGASPRPCARRSNPPASQWRKLPASAARRTCF